jgi:hypothetical protein
MTADGGVRVVPDALVTHAASIDRVGEAVQLGVDAARQIRLGAGAYGRLCQLLPGMLDPLHEQADRVLSEARGALDETARSLRAAADRYADTDANVAARLGLP